MDNIECPLCGRVSYNKGDIEYKFCGACNCYHDEFELGDFGGLVRSYKLSCDSKNSFRCVIRYKWKFLWWDFNGKKTITGYNISDLRRNIWRYLRDNEFIVK